MNSELISESGTRSFRYFSKTGLIVAGLVGVALVVILRSAWVSDDAYITFRVVDNLWHGHGLRWNISERVCVYTNPLMMLSMAGLYPLSQEFFYTSIFFSVFVSIAAIGIVLRRLAGSVLTMIFVVALLITSKAFIDYTTSGLEQCLTYLLAALFYLLTFKRRPHSDRTFLLMALVCGFATLNRADTILLFLPVLLLCWWDKRSFKRIVLVGVGFLPFVLWEVFSLVYYGSLLPNTFYAKLNSGLDVSFYLRQGMAYYNNSLKVDPITLPTIFAAIVVCVRSRRKFIIAAALGVFLYLLYIVRVGGGFMSGRYFSGPFFCALMLWCVCPVKISKMMRQACLALVAGAIVLVCVLHPLSPVRNGSGYDTSKSRLQSYKVNNGIADERGYYYKTNGLLRAWHYPEMPAHHWRYEAITDRNLPGYTHAVRIAVGMYGFFAGPDVHVIDEAALADPFLARLGVPHDKYYTRVGHMLRILPLDYIKSIRTGKNEFGNAEMSEMYDMIGRIHSGPIWSPQRWADIWAMHTYKRHGVPDAGEHEDDLAMGYLNKIIELDPRRLSFRNRRGVVYLRRGKYDRAISDLDAAIELKPDFATGYYNRGISYAHKRLYGKAVRDFSKAIELKPRYLIAYNRRGQVYLEKGQYDRAISDFSEAISVDPRFVPAYKNRAKAYLSKGDNERAERDINTVRQLSIYEP